MTQRKILTKKQAGLGWLTIDNPERRNAINLEMWQAIADSLADFEADPLVRVVIVRGAGGRTFTSGADISEFEAQRQNAQQSEVYNRITEVGKKSFVSLQKPLIAMIQGACVGGGISIAATADIRVASDDAYFAVPAARLGLGYPFESVKKLVQLVGPAFAKDILFTARRLSASEALDIGLVNRVVSAEQLEATVQELAMSIARNAPLTVRAAKIAVNQATIDAEERDMTLIDASVRACFDSQDYVIGRRAFMERKIPEFTGA